MRIFSNAKWSTLVLTFSLVGCGSTSTGPGSGATGSTGGSPATGGTTGSGATGSTAGAASGATSGSGATGNATTGSTTGNATTGSTTGNATTGNATTGTTTGGVVTGSTTGSPSLDAGFADATTHDGSSEGGITGFDSSVRTDGATNGPLPWPLANQIVSEIVPPTFPATTFSVTTYGAKCDGVTDDTAAFKQAVTACSAAGGGHVVVPAATCVVGAITLLSNVDLHLSSPQTTLQFTGDVTKYPMVLTRFRGTELMNHSPMIYAYGQTNIALTGSGTLDLAKTAAFQVDTPSGVTAVTVWGQNGTPVAQRVLPAGATLRSPSVEPYNSQNILIQGVTINNGQFWNIHPTLCKNVTVDGVTIFATAQETDGCNPESSDHVLIENVTFRTGDDAVAVKSGRDNDGRRVNVPSTNIVVQHVHFDDNYGILAIGSEESGGVSHVFGYDMTAVDNSNRGVGLHFQYALFMKANYDRGGVVNDINLDTIKMSNISGPAVFVDLTYNNITTGAFPPTFGNVSLNHVTVNGALQFLYIVATPTHPFGAISIANSTFTNVANPVNTLTNVVPPPTITAVTVNGVAQ